MGVNKVEAGGTTIIDISDSTLTEETMLAGTVGYSASGERTTGNATPVLYTVQSLTDAQKEQARENIGAGAKYSPIKKIAFASSPYTIVADDLGKTLLFDYASDEATTGTVITIPQEISNAMPYGAELSVYFMHGKTCSISFTGNQRVDLKGKNRLSAPTTIKVTEKKGTVTLKKIHVGPDIWVADGDVEMATLKATFLATNWTASNGRFYQTVSVTGIISTDEPVVDLNLEGLTITQEDAIIEDWANIVKINTGNGVLTAYASEVPSVNIPIKIKR